MFPEPRGKLRAKFNASSTRGRKLLGRLCVFFSGRRIIVPDLPDAAADALPPVSGSSSTVNPAGGIPFFPQDHDTHYLTSECAVNDALRPIVDGVVGFDTEFMDRRPTADEIIINEVIDLVLEARRSNPFPFAWDTMGLCIVQIARGRDVWIIDIRRMKVLPGQLKRVLTSPDIIKVGLGVVNDIPVIWNDLRLDVNNLVDAGMMARLLLVEKYPNGAYQNLSMDTAAQEILGFRVNKDEQVSDWTGTLSDAQLRYAGTDAIVVLRLYEALQPQLRARASQLGRDIPDAWYNFNSRMGEPTRVKRTVHGVVVPWSEKSWTGRVVHPGMIRSILFVPSRGPWRLGSITQIAFFKLSTVTGE
ncbi:ribonuclease H-like domain-containing protein [Mycena vulgaris]|nr:ribonuclease H-like domain-containing protein [Mycena vulgaris]